MLETCSCVDARIEAVRSMDEVWMGNRSDTQECISWLTALCHLRLEVRASADVETAVFNKSRKNMNVSAEEDGCW